MQGQGSTPVDLPPDVRIKKLASCIHACLENSVHFPARDIFSCIGSHTMMPNNDLDQVIITFSRFHTR